MLIINSKKGKNNFQMIATVDQIAVYDYQTEVLSY